LKKTILSCDRCKKDISFFDEQFNEFLAQEYPGLDICADCDGLLVLASSLQTHDLIRGNKQGTALKKMLEQYS
jgi:cobyrinic acid a,c-diamide synthase